MIGDFVFFRRANNIEPGRIVAILENSIELETNYGNTTVPKSHVFKSIENG